MILEICAILIILACFVLIVYLLTRSRGAVSIEKKADSGDLLLSLKANKDIRQVEVSGLSESGEDIRFTRKDLKKGERVEFVFPLTRNPIQVTITDESGNKIISA
jgi:hypothetical protein